MRLGFLSPGEADRRKLAAMQEGVVEMRQDQITYLEHLLRSWGIFGSRDGIALTWRAIKRTLHERP